MLLKSMKTIWPSCPSDNSPRDPNSPPGVVPGDPQVCPVAPNVLVIMTKRDKDCPTRLVTARLSTLLRDIHIPMKMAALPLDTLLKMVALGRRLVVWIASLVASMVTLILMARRESLLMSVDCPVISPMKRMLESAMKTLIACNVKTPSVPMTGSGLHLLSSWMMTKSLTLLGPDNVSLPMKPGLLLNNNSLSNRATSLLSNRGLNKNPLG